MDVLLPICYLPPISYFQLIVKAQNVELELHENFVKQSYRNRCEIYGANGKLKLIVPVQHKGERILFKDVKISYAENWQKIHWKSLEAAYRTSPFFEYYEHHFHSFYHNNKIAYLKDLNIALMELLLKLLSINKKLMFTDKYSKEGNFEDYRSKFDKKQLHPLQNSSKYIQVFENKLGFIENLSIVDLLFNEGPNSLSYL
jgi:hypothetical protein